MAFSSSLSQTSMSMSEEELRAISQAINRDFAPRRFRAAAARLVSPGFSPQELLSISQQISREFAPRPTDRAGLTKVVALPVDPEHLHVYWQLDEASPGPAPVVEEPQDAQALTLRVYTPSELTGAKVAGVEPMQNWFDVPVAADHAQQQIRLPVDRPCITGMYQVALGRLNENQEFAVLARSAPAVVAPKNTPAAERLSPMMAAFIIPASQASSVLTVTASGQQN